MHEKKKGLAFDDKQSAFIGGCSFLFYPRVAEWPIYDRAK
ncbi:hypothetical protein SD77_3839 [Bacillus badius]|uniref:Uncharacterized protein n=1 Tax=Bacillus badius TaxID=1455 RepID=A0ABR5AXV3_BACBA|nr:hypothetical protein SD78_1639 [Bacillus badius]KIL79038.1 hypothetical protein SD77_3839 [Bacillus badius]